MSIGYVCLDVKFSLFFSLLADKPTTTPRRGFIGKGKDITTKHDEVVCGRKNTARMENVSENFRKLTLYVKLECCNSAKELMLVHQCCWVGCFFFFFSLLDESNAVFALLVIHIGSLNFVGFLFNNSLLLSNSRICTKLFWQNKTISKFGKQANKTQKLF